MAAFHVVTLLLLLIVAFGQTTLRPSNDMSLEIFKDIDRNKDLQVKRDEVDYYFLGYDYNADGRITQQEFSEYIFTHYPDLSAYDTNLYDFFDFNNDRILNHVDFDNLFTQMDTDNNDIVDQGEFVRYFNVIFDSLGNPK